MCCYGNIFLSFSSSPGLETDSKATDLKMTCSPTREASLSPKHYLCFSIFKDKQNGSGGAPSYLSSFQLKILQSFKQKSKNHQWTKPLGNTGIHYKVILSQASVQAWVTKSGPGKIFPWSQRKGTQAMEMFMRCWRQETITRTSGPSIDRYTMTLWRGKLCPGRPNGHKPKKDFPLLSAKRPYHLSRSDIFSHTFVQELAQCQQCHTWLQRTTVTDLRALWIWR